MKRILLILLPSFLSAFGFAQITADSVPTGMYAVNPNVNLSISTCQQSTSAWFDIDCDSIPDFQIKIYKGYVTIDDASYADLHVLNNSIEICSDTTQYAGPYKRPHYYQAGDTLNCQAGAQWMNDTAYQLAYFGCMLCNGPGTINNKYIAYRKNSFIGWMKLSFFIGTSACSGPDSVSVSAVLAACASLQSQSCQIAMTYTPETCPGCCDGSASVQLVNGCSPVTYTWAPMGASSSTVHNICSGMVFTVMTSDNGGANCCGVMSQTVSLPSTTSIKKNHYENDPSLVPNPAASGFIIKGRNSDIFDTEIYDCTGRIVYRKNISERELVDVSGLTNGIYTVAIKEEEYTTIRKLIVLH